MVCLGNICRSPLAHGIMNHLGEKHGVELTVDSAGTGAYHEGERPDKRSIEVAKQHGIDITNQRSRQFEVSDFRDFDVIYVMDASNYKNICKLTNSDVAKAKVKFILNEVTPNGNQSVPDPYYGGEQGFKEVYDMLYKACSEIIKDLS